MILKPISSEKAVKIVDLDNTLLFEVGKNVSKEEIKDEVEKVFTVKVESVRTLIKDNRKRAYVRLKKENPAIDIVTKLGMI